MYKGIVLKEQIVVYIVFMVLYLHPTPLNSYESSMSACWHAILRLLLVSW